LSDIIHLLKLGFYLLGFSLPRQCATDCTTVAYFVFYYYMPIYYKLICKQKHIITYYKIFQGNYNFIIKIWP